MFEQLGAALRLLREEAGLSQRALALRCRQSLADCSVTQAMLSQWERGEQMPALRTVGQVLEVLGCDLFDLHQSLTMVSPGARGKARENPRRNNSSFSELLDLELAALRSRMKRIELQLMRPRRHSANRKKDRQS